MLLDRLVWYILLLGFLCPICPVNRSYEIKNMDKETVGKIVNIWNGCGKELCSRADKFGINFPKGANTD